MSGLGARRRSIAAASGVVGFLGAWEGLVRLLDIRPFILRPPSAAVAAVWRARGDFASAALVTVGHAAGGLAIALVIGVCVGMLVTTRRFLEDATQPVLVLVQVAPWFAYVGSVVVWLGAGTRPAIFMVALVTLPAFVFAATDGLRTVDPAALELFASVDARRWEVMWRLRLPNALPTVFTATRFNIGLALAAAYFVEGANFATRGIGAIGRRAAAQPGAADTLWGAVLVMAALGSAALLTLSAVQRVTLSWHMAMRQPT